MIILYTQLYNFKHRSLLVFLIAGLAAMQTTNNLNATEEIDEAQSELAQVESAIADIESWLSEANEQQSNEEKNLKAAEVEIAEVTKSLATLELTLVGTQIEIDSLTLRIHQLESDKVEQTKPLEQVIRAAYIAGEQNSLKVLLNQEDITKSGRLLEYSRMFSKFQLTKIQEYQSTLKKLASVNTRLANEVKELTLQQDSLIKQNLDLSEAKTAKQLALSELNINIISRAEELEQQEVNQLQLQALIEEITQAMERVQSVVDLPPFNDQQGQLNLPVAGPIISRFGSTIGEGDLERQGITISVAEGTPVQAVYSGRVVFSDWLRGAGMLVIVDHGDGYMSLYSANQALAKQAGDWVETGDVVATSGQGSNTDTPGIYFEIRHRGQAQNPSGWFNN